MSKTKTNKESNLEAPEGYELQRVLYIYYPAHFDRFSIETLIDLGSKINTMQSSFVRKLGLGICKTDVGAQKIDNRGLQTFKMVIALFQIDEKDKKSRFFEETFILADISINITFGIFFLTLNNVKIDFNN